MKIELEILQDEFFFEQNLNEVIPLLGIDPDYVERIRGEFKWMPPGATPGSAG